MRELHACRNHSFSRTETEDVCSFCFLATVGWSQGFAGALARSFFSNPPRPADCAPTSIPQEVKTALRIHHHHQPCSKGAPLPRLSIRPFVRLVVGFGPCGGRTGVASWRFVAALLAHSFVISSMKPFSPRPKGDRDTVAGSRRWGATSVYETGHGAGANGRVHGEFCG